MSADSDLATLARLAASVPPILRLKFTLAGVIAAAARAAGLDVEALCSRSGIRLQSARAIMIGAVAEVPVEELALALTAFGRDVEIRIPAAPTGIGKVSLTRPDDAAPQIATEIVRTKGVMSSEPCFRGTRIPAATVLSFVRDPHTTATSVFEDYPGLPVDAFEALARWIEEDGSAKTAPGPGP